MISEVKETAAIIWQHRMSNLVGELLTIADATTTDKEQKKAIKDLIVNTCWKWYESSPQAESEGQDSAKFTIVKV